MTWLVLPVADTPNCKSKSGGQSCCIMALNNRQYVHMADNEGDPGPSVYKPPKKTQILKISFGDGKGSPWKPPPTNTKKLEWGVDGGTDGDGGGSKIKPGKCDVW